MGVRGVGLRVHGGDTRLDRIGLVADLWNSWKGAWTDPSPPVRIVLSDSSRNGDRHVILGMKR
jgi:hypothetical protein